MTWTPELESRARELLAAATPRPWTWTDRDCGPLLRGADKDPHECHAFAVVLGLQVGVWPSADDRELIAEGPSLLEAALAEIERLRSTLSTIGQLLEDELGGFYLSAPDTDPLGRVRAFVRRSPP